MDMGRLRWGCSASCAFYVFLSADPAGRDAGLRRLAEDSRSRFRPPPTSRSSNFRQALSINAVRIAMWNSLILGAVTATLGVAITGLLAWIILRSRLPGRGVLEYLVMFPQAVPRLVFAFGMMWAWLVFPLPDLRHVLGPADRLPDRVHAARRAHDLRRHSAARQEPRRVRPGLRRVLGLPPAHASRRRCSGPGLLAAWLLIFVASVRELGASILLMGPDSKVMTPAIVEAWFSTSSELTAAMALIQTRGDRPGHARVRPAHAPAGACTGRPRNDGRPPHLPSRSRTCRSATAP